MPQGRRKYISTANIHVIITKMHNYNSTFRNYNEHLRGKSRPRKKLWVRYGWCIVPSDKFSFFQYNL